MKIGMILDNQFFGDTRVVNEAVVLAKLGHDVNVLCFNHGDYSKFAEYKNVKLHRFDFPIKIKNKFRPFMLTLPIYTKVWAKQIVKFVKNQKIDVLHIHDLYMVAAVKQAFPRKKLPCVVDLHENYPAAIKSYLWAQGLFAKLFVKPDKWKKIEPELLNYVDRIIVLSEAYRDKLISEYCILKKEKFGIYPNVPDTKEFLSYKINQIEEHKDKLVMLYFGAIAHRRGIFTVFDAMLKLRDKLNDIFVWMIGPVDNADKKRFDSYMENDFLKDKVKFIPWLSIEELPSYLKVTDVCLSPILKNDQHESGIANKVFQYMLFEKPVIVSNCLPQQQLIEENKCGLVHNSDDATDLANTIEHFYQMKSSWNEMGKRGKDAILAKYNVQNAGLELDRLYKEISNK
jgi:glycosyltransferase involved in cell wall biosynthesis